MPTPCHDTPAAGPLPSPCIGVCRMQACNDLCSGCLRTIEEIAAWGSASEAERQVIWQRIAGRRAALGKP